MAEPKAVKFLGPDAEITPTKFLGPDAPLTAGATTAPPPDQPPPGMLSRIASGAGQGVKNIATGLVKLPMVLANTPGRVWEDVKALATDPLTAIPAQAQRGVEFGKAMLPMYETGKSLLSGEIPPAETVSREATEFGTGYGIGKLAKPATIGAAKAVTRNLPGAAVELNELAAGTLRALPEGVRPTPGLAKRTYHLLDQIQAPKVAMNETGATIQRLLAKEMSLADPDKAFVKVLRNYQAKSRRGMGFKDIQNNVVDLGEKIGQHAASKGTKLGEMRDLLGALHADAADAIPLGGATAHGALQVKSGLWDTARLLSRREFAANDLTRMIEKSGITTVGDGFTQVNTNKLVSQIDDLVKLAKQDKRAKLFVESFQPGELNKIVADLKEIGASAPKVPPKTGTPVGSSQRWMEAGVGSLAGTAIGGMTGNAGLGAMIGAPAGPIASTLIAKMMMSDAGRALVRKAVIPVGRVTPQNAALFSMFLKAQEAGND